MKIIISEKQLKEILGVDSTYLELGGEKNGGMENNNYDSEVFVNSKMDNDIPEPSTTDKISRKRTPRSYFGAPRQTLKCSKTNAENLLNEENKDLKDKKYTLPNKLYACLKNKLNAYTGGDDKGIRRLKNIVEMRSLSTNEMYRILNRLNTISTDSDEYSLLCGNDLKKWIENQLKTAKNLSKSSKEVKKSMGFENAFIKKHSKDSLNGMGHSKKQNGVTFEYEK